MEISGSPRSFSSQFFVDMNVYQIIYILLIQLILGYVLSEQAKMAHLQEKIKRAKSNKRAGVVSMILGVVSISAGIMVNRTEQLVNRTGQLWGFIAMGALGIFLFVYGLYALVRYSHEYGNTMKELQSTVVPSPTA